MEFLKNHLQALVTDKINKSIHHIEYANIEYLRSLKPINHHNNAIFIADKQRRFKQKHERFYNYSIIT